MRPTTTHRTPPLYLWALYLWALCALATLSLSGCIEGTDGPTITRARPAPALPGAPLRIDGVNFGEAGHVAIGGRPVIERVRTPDHIEVELPPDLPSGPSWLVVVADGRPSPEFPIEIGGDNPPIGAGPRVFPPGFDSGRADAGRPRDRGPGVDVGRDMGGGLVAEFDPDPAGDGAVRLIARDAPAGRLVLEVAVPDRPIRGIALHLAYDRGLLRFTSSRPAGTRRLVASEIGPGRLAIGRLMDRGAEPVVLTFDLVGPGEGRIDVPARNRTARDVANRPIPGVDFAGGGVRVRRR